MKFEFSAGGIVFKKRGEKIFVLIARHSAHHGWVFPKGLIGDHIKGEKKEDTALREVEEETGVKGKIIQELSPVVYWYNFDHEKIRKTVYYYLMKYAGGSTKKHDFEMEDVRWVPLDKVEEYLTYKSDKKVFEEARPLILEIAKKKEVA
jgi:8-oxo-dGTP pyrophosphatase MutT (NUDIX family)